MCPLYDKIGTQYSHYRSSDTRIAAAIWKEIDERLFPSIEQLEEILGAVRVLSIPIPHDCTDGFLCAYWRRPQYYLDERVRGAISTFSRIANIGKGMRRLQEDLEAGRWHKRYQYLLNKESMDFGYRIVVSA